MIYDPVRGCFEDAGKKAEEFRMRIARENDEHRLLELLRHKSFEQKEVTLASGRKSNFYIDCKKTVLDGEGAVLTGRLLYWEIQKAETGHAPIAAVGGPELGAVPLAIATSMTAALSGRTLPSFIVRKEAKDHGTATKVEGLSPRENPLDSRQCLFCGIMEDVITTGGSALKAVKAVKELGHFPVAIFALVDRDEGGRQALEAEGLKVYSLFTRHHFMT